MRVAAAVLSLAGAAVGGSSAGCIFIAAVDADLLADAGAQGGGGAGGQGGGGQGGGGAGPTGCTGDAMCDDGNRCTGDACELATGRCAFSPLPAGTACPVGDACDGDETCDGAGQCQAGSPPTLDDGDPCTTDACDPATGPSHAPIASCVPWKPLPGAAAPSPRYDHTAVWTGSKMIVWGGSVTGDPDVTATGGVYDPASRTWTATSTAGAPSARTGHRAVWTGSRMLVWGGYADADFATGGGSYDPATDTWTAIPSLGEPTPRVQHAAVWTGDALVVWGGFTTVPLGTGGIYRPATSTWTPVSPAGAPNARFGHTGTWTGARMIVWGGQNLFDWHDTGALLDPALAGGAWTGATSGAGAPFRREGHSATWTGEAMIVWGGWTGGPFVDSGGIYDPVADTWIATSTTGAPIERRDHVALWTGDELLVWGGAGGENLPIVFGDGGRFVPDPTGGVWTPVPVVDTLGARRDHAGVWTGTEAILWGGRDGDGVPLGTGAAATL